MNQPAVGLPVAAQRAPGEPAAPLNAATAYKPAAAPSWSSAPLGTALGEDAAAWDALAARLTQGHPALSSAWVDSWLQDLPSDSPIERRLVWRGSRAAPSAMGLVECLGNQRWRILAPLAAWTAAMLLGDLNDLRELATAIPGGLRSLDWPRWDATVLPLDLGAVEVAFDLCPVTTARELRQADVPGADHAGETPEAARTSATVQFLQDPAALPAMLARLQTLAAAADAVAWPRTDINAGMPIDMLAALAQRGLAASVELRDGANQLVAMATLAGARRRWRVCGWVLRPDPAYADAGLLRLLSAAMLELAADPIDAKPAAPAGDLQLLLPDAPMLAGIGNLHTQADLRLHLGRNAWLHEWRARPRPKTDVNGLQVRCDDGLAALPPAAIVLLDSQNATSLQLGADWLSTMEQVLRKDPSSRPCIYSLWREDRPLAVVAMQSRSAPGPLGARSLHGMSNFYSVLWAPALAPDVQALELAPLVARLRADAGLMEFSPVDLAAPSMWTWVRALRDGGLVVLRHPAFANWTHATSADSKAYLAARTSQLRRMIKRGNQRLKERGGHLEILTRPEDMPRAMDAYEAVYARSWKQAEPHPEFFRELARRWARLDRMRIGVAWLDGEPIAAQWWTCHAGVAEIHKLAYDDSHSELGAGTALSATLFAHVLDHDRVHKIDYLIGDDAYKQLWMSMRKFRCSLLVFDPKSAAGAVGLLREAASRVRRLWRHSRARRAPVAT